MSFDVDKWTDELIELLKASLNDFRQHCNEEMSAFAVDCHPWHGYIGLAFLTTVELSSNPSWRCPAEMAIWKYFQFGENTTCWKTLYEPLSQAMRAQYSSATDGLWSDGEHKASIARMFLRACSRAVSSPAVQDQLRQFSLNPDFQITIPHPDTEEEFYQPAMM